MLWIMNTKRSSNFIVDVVDVVVETFTHTSLVTSLKEALVVNRVSIKFNIGNAFFTLPPTAGPYIQPSFIRTAEQSLVSEE